MTVIDTVAPQKSSLVVERVSVHLPTNADGRSEEKRDLDSIGTGAVETVAREYETQSAMLSDAQGPCGSLQLGKQRRQSEVVTTEPEKHLSPRAATKEFSFPKSN